MSEMGERWLPISEPEMIAPMLADNMVNSPKPTGLGNPVAPTSRGRQSGNNMPIVPQTVPISVDMVAAIIKNTSGHQLGVRWWPINDARYVPVPKSFLSMSQSVQMTRSVMMDDIVDEIPIFIAAKLFVSVRRERER